MLIYTNHTLFGTNESGEAIVYDWAHEEGFFAEIRVEAIRKYVEDAWKVNWHDKEAVTARFNIEKIKHAASAHDACRASPTGFRAYVIGSSDFQPEHEATAKVTGKR